MLLQEDNDWQGTPGSWFLDTLLGYDSFGSQERSRDMIYIDYGAKWFVRGMVPVLKEAEEEVYGKIEESKEEPIRYTGKFVRDPNNPELLYHGGKYAGMETTKYHQIDKKLTDKQYDELMKLKKEKSDLDIGLKDGTDEKTYLQILSNTLPKLIKNIKPDFAFYLSGVDILDTDKFGKLKVIKIIGKTKNDGMLWECLCDCGSIVNIPAGRLTRKTKATTSCGCIGRPNYSHLIGQRFNKLVVIDLPRIKNIKRRR